MKHKTSNDNLPYAQLIATLETGNRADWQNLAAHPDTPREALYYLAEKGNTDVRALVARNPATPYQADAFLVSDDAEDVRAELARKIGRLVPGLPESERTKLREQAISLMETLAQDQATKVRALLVEAIKSSPHVPKDVIRRLANDHELVVCGPILEYSPLLGDADLKEIIAASRTRGALSSIARRTPISGDLAEALATSNDVDAIATLLGNRNAQIREDTLDAILDSAPAVPSWHEPLALRASLSTRVMRRIAGFVAASLVDQMLAAHVLSNEDADSILKSVKHRIDAEPVNAHLARDEDTAAHALALHAIASGQFDNTWVAAQLSAGDHKSIVEGLAMATGFKKSVDKIIASKNGQAVMALCWKAGLSARTAYDIQQKLVRIPASQLITPKGGTQFPLPHSEMENILALFGEA